jgi:glycerate kinase
MADQATLDNATEPASSQKVTIDGTEYNLDDLSENARSQVVNLRVTDQEVARIKQQLAIYQTARTAYARALGEELPKKEH